MAEFCFECYKKFHGENRKEENYIISDELDLCEGCGKYQKVVICYKRNGFFSMIEDIVDIFLFPLKLLKNFIILLILKIRK